MQISKTGNSRLNALFSYNIAAYLVFSFSLDKREEGPLSKSSDVQAICKIQETSCLHVSCELYLQKVKEMHRIKCRVETGSKRVFHYFRAESWVPPYLNPGSGVSESRGELVFHMALLNGEVVALAKWSLKGRFQASCTLCQSV